MRNKSLDGLRGLAVLMVLLYHHAVLNMGWTGVDLFFVLSGYLITTILRRTRDDKCFWGEFWSKRVTRILPPLLLLICASAILTRDVSFPQAIAYLLSFGDILAYVRTNVEPVRLLWSLAVEEHFYIVWPFAVRYLSRRSLVVILISTLIAEPILRAAASLFSHDWTFVYFLSPFRLDGLTCGALLAVGFERSAIRSFVGRWSVSVGVGTMAVWSALRLTFGVSFTRAGDSVLYNSTCYSLTALLALCLIAYVLTHPSSFISNVFAFPPLVFLGSISYGLYLYQMLMKELMVRHTHLAGIRLLLVDTVVTIIVAWLSFVYYERPLFSWGKTYAETLRSSPGVKQAGLV